MRVALAFGYRDREMIGWTATAAGVSGKLICDMMVECVETRFGVPRAPVRIQWLTDNGSVYAAAETIDLTLALNLEPCFTPVESPESDGMAEAFVKTFKRDYVRVNPISDAAIGIAVVAYLIEVTTSFTLTAGSDTARRASISGPCSSLPPVRSDGVNSM